MNTDISADLIAFLVSQYEQPEVAAPPAVTLTKVQRQRATTVNMRKVSAPPTMPAVAPVDTARNAAPPPEVKALPAKGTLDARGYFLAQRAAKTRDERIAAISAYIGYSAALTYSQQEYAANARAKREINPPKASPAVPGAAVSLRGFVAGMPDPIAKKKADLEGRQVYCAEQIGEYNKAAKAALEAGNEVEAMHNATMAQLETDRLTQIRADLAAL
jgi:hypothetical protein